MHNAPAVAVEFVFDNKPARSDFVEPSAVLGDSGCHDFWKLKRFPQFALLA
jgi:hypothetical protein